MLYATVCYCERSGFNFIPKEPLSWNASAAVLRKLLKLVFEVQFLQLWHEDGKCVGLYRGDRMAASCGLNRADWLRIVGLDSALRSVSVIANVM